MTTRKKYNAPTARRRRKRKSNRTLWLLAVCAVIVAAGMWMPDNCAATGDSTTPATATADDLQYVVTNPALDSELIHYTGMTVSFNPTLHIPNWVAYELTADEARGDEPRTNRFAADPDVSGCADPDDYRNTGFDRGHMAPAADMKWSSEAMRESFYMTNIAPQEHRLNSGAWSKLESKCRERALRDSAVIIITGPVSTDPVEMHIGTTGVAVPARFFKVILSPYTVPPTAIGFVMPNGYVEGGIQASAVSVDEVEAITGHDFFSALPDEIENEVEQKVNFNRWSRML